MLWIWWKSDMLSLSVPFISIVFIFLYFPFWLVFVSPCNLSLLIYQLSNIIPEISLWLMTFVTPKTKWHVIFSWYFIYLNGNILIILNILIKCVGGVLIYQLMSQANSAPIYFYCSCGSSVNVSLCLCVYIYSETIVVVFWFLRLKAETYILQTYWMSADYSLSPSLSVYLSLCVCVCCLHLKNCTWW